MVSFDQSCFHFSLTQFSSDNFSVIKFQSNEYGLGLDYEFQLTVCSKRFFALKDCQNDRALLTWEWRYTNYYMNGIISHLTFFGKKDNRFVYTLSLRSPLFLLKLSQTNRTFVQKTLIEILKTLFSTYPLIHYQIHFKKHLKPLPLIIQYNQTDFDFFHWLIQRFGCWYYFEQSLLQACLIIADSVPGFKTPSTELISFVDANSLIKKAGVAFDCQQVVKKGFNEITFLQTDHAGLVPGQCLQLENHPNDLLNRVYRIIKLMHVADQSATLSRYKNKVILIPVEQSFCLPIKDLVSPYSHEIFSLVLQAKITSSAGLLPIDQKGQYQIKFHFDCDQNEIPCKAYIVQPYGGRTLQHTYGISFSLRPDTEVAVGFENNNLSRPIILGILNSVNSPNVVTQQNAYQNRIRTYAGNEMIFSDQKDNHFLEWHTQCQNQCFRISTQKNKAAIQLANYTGAVNFSAKQDLELHALLDQTIHVENNFLNNIGGSYEMLTKNGDVRIRAKLNIEFIAKNAVRLCADEIFVNSFNVQTKTRSFLVRTDRSLMMRAASFYIQANHINLFGAQCVSIQNAFTIANSRIHFKRAIFQAAVIIKPNIA